MKKLLSIVLLCCSSTLLLFNCSNSSQPNSELSEQADNVDTQIASSSTDSTSTNTLQTGSMTDPRDGEVYATIMIWKQTWLAENLRYNAPGSMLHPENPSIHYGRLYKLTAAQTACPEGWHLPSDSEWDKLEIAHGMPTSFIGKGGWRGEHAPNLRSVAGWDENGVNSLGFNVLPAGYYFPEELGGGEGIQGLEGLGYSAAFWSSVENGTAMARFMFDARQFVNKWEDKNNDSGAALACRCVMD